MIECGLHRGLLEIADRDGNRAIPEIAVGIQRTGRDAADGRVVEIDGAGDQGRGRIGGGGIPGQHGHRVGDPEGQRTPSTARGGDAPHRVGRLDLDREIGFRAFDAADRETAKAHASRKMESDVTSIVDVGLEQSLLLAHGCEKMIRHRSRHRCHGGHKMSTMDPHRLDHPSGHRTPHLRPSRIVPHRAAQHRQVPYQFVEKRRERPGEPSFGPLAGRARSGHRGDDVDGPMLEMETTPIGEPADQRSGHGFRLRIARPLGISDAALLILLASCLSLLLLSMTATVSVRAAAADPFEPFGLEAAQASWIRLDLESGRVLESHLADRPRIPASTAKLATALAALEILGPDRRLATRLLATGPVMEGELRGALVLQGGGDPLLDVADLFDLALALRQRGIRRVRGAYLVDDHLFPHFPEIDPGEPASAAYNAGIGPLTVEFGRVRLLAGPFPASIPPLFEAELAWSDRPVAPPEVARLRRKGERRIWEIPRGGRARALPVRDPGLQAAELFRLLAGEVGIRLPPPRRSGSPQAGQLLAEHRSEPLSEIVRAMLLYSNNQVAETLGLLATRSLSGTTPSSLAASAMLLRRFLEQRLSETDWRGARLANHSGLGTGTRLTARQLAAMLRYGARRHRLPAMLPASGWAGTLRRRLSEAPAALRVWAKTGTMDFASAVAGYLLPEEGGMEVFAILVEDGRARRAYDAQRRKSAALLARADAWNRRARAFEDRRIRRWLGILR